MWNFEKQCPFCRWRCLQNNVFFIYFIWLSVTTQINYRYACFHWTLQSQQSFFSFPIKKYVIIGWDAVCCHTILEWISQKHFLIISQPMLVGYSMLITFGNQPIKYIMCCHKTWNSQKAGAVVRQVNSFDGPVCSCFEFLLYIFLGSGAKRSMTCKAGNDN